MNSCPCNSGKSYSNCCELIINKTNNAATAEELMRSRYTAFTISDISYLMHSHHPKTRPIKDKKEIKKWSQSVTWVSLQIVNTTKGNIEDTEGTVEFIATYIENGQKQQIHENSNFVKCDNRWVYLDGRHSE